MAEQKMNFSKMLAMLAQPKAESAPLENVDRRIEAVPFIGVDGTVKSEKIKIVIPQNLPKPMPLIWIPHYEIGEDSMELRDYLAEGWAVACPTEAPADANGKLSGDGVIFNNAALFMLRRMPEFDSERIALVGGSAGGYMALMQTGTNLGICATIANGPIANVYFNFCHYWPNAQALNMPVFLQMTMQQNPQDTQQAQDPKMALMQKLAKLPIPLIAALNNSFAPNAQRQTAESDPAQWEESTPVGIAQRFSNPVMVNHNTSDVLVPVDQITRKFTYLKPGDSLPEDFDLRLPADLPGKLKFSLDECMPADKTCVKRTVVPEGPQPDDVLPYDSEKMFNLNIFDDGPPEGYGSHSSRTNVGRRFDVPYLKLMFAKTTAKTNDLTPEMLRYMLELYCGYSIGYPVFNGVDPDIYGSIQMYRKKICIELEQWSKHHGKDSLSHIFADMIRGENPANSDRLNTTMNEILSLI